MQIQQVPSPHHSSRNGGSVLAVVDHIMAGSLAGCDAWFQNPVSQVSAHYGIGKNGEIHQYVAESEAAWHAGVLNAPNLAALPWLPAGVNPNRFTIGIEHEGQSGDALTPAQMTATVELHRYLCEKYGIPADRQHIVPHAAFDSVNRSGCPGPGFPWDALFAALAGQQPDDRAGTLQTAIDVTRGWSEAMTQASKELADVAAMLERLK